MTAPATRTDIISNAATYINRSSDTAALTLLGIGYEIAFKQLQRYYPHYSGVEVTDYIDFIENIDIYDVFDNFKDPILAYVWDQNISKVIAFYNKVNITTLRERRLKTDPSLQANIIPDTFETYLYAIHAGEFHFWPTVSGDLVGKQFGMDYIKWATSTDESNFFVTHAFDYLMFRSLREMVPSLGLTDTFERQIKQREDEALKTFVSAEITRVNSGPLRIRG